jgi:hypothetical protein
MLAPLCAGVSPGMILAGTCSETSLSGALVATSGSAMVISLFWVEIGERAKWKDPRGVSKQEQCSGCLELTGTGCACT